MARRQTKKNMKVTKKRAAKLPAKIVSSVESNTQRSTEKVKPPQPSPTVLKGPAEFQGVISIETGGRKYNALVLTDDMTQLLTDTMRMNNGLKWIRDARQRNEHGKKLVEYWWNDLPDDMKDVPANTCKLPWLDKMDRDLSNQYVHLMTKSRTLEQDIVEPREKLFKAIGDVLVEHGVLLRKDILDPEDPKMVHYKTEWSEPSEPYHEDKWDHAQYWESDSPRESDLGALDEYDQNTQGSVS